MPLVCRHCAHVFSESDLGSPFCPYCHSRTKLMEYFPSIYEAEAFARKLREESKAVEHLEGA